MRGFGDSHKKELMAIILAVSAIILIYVKVVYFPPRYEYGENDNFQKIIKDTKNATENFQNEYSQFASSMDSIKNAFDDSPKKDAISQDDALKFQEGISNLVNKKNIEKLDSFILDIKNNLPEDWEMKITTLERGLDDLLIAEVLFEGKKECGAPDIFFPKKRLAFYPASSKTQLQEAIEKYNGIMREGMCRQAIAHETEKFLILDSCSNARSCEDEKELEDSLKKYFEIHREQILN